MRALRSMTVIAAATALAALAACGGSDDGSPATGATPTIAAAEVKAGPPTAWDDGGYTVDPSTLQCGGSASDPTRGVTATSIRVGGLAYLTSPSGSSMAGANVGAKVRFARANEAGGVNGRKIDFIGTLDDGMDATRNTAQAKVLAEQQKVFAVVPEMTAFANYLDTFCSEKVPFFGWGFNNAFCHTAVGFGLTGCLSTSGDQPTSSTQYGVMIQSLFGGDAKGKTVAIVVNDDDNGRGGMADWKIQVQSVGAKVVYAEAAVPDAGLTDTTAIVNKIMTSASGAPADVILYATEFNATTKLVQALSAAGYTGKHITAVGYDPRLAAANFPGLQKSYTLLQWGPAEDTSSAGVQQLVADFKKYAPDEPVGLPEMAGYWSADMFLDAVTKTGPDLTVDSFLKTLNTDYSYLVEGAVAPVRYPLNHAVNVPCASLVQLNGTKYDVATKLVCGQILVK